MMGHHLNMILPPSLGIEYERLVDIEGDLEKTIKLDGTSQRDMRVIQPQVRKMQQSRGKVAMHVLGRKRVRWVLAFTPLTMLLTMPRLKFMV